MAAGTVTLTEEKISAMKRIKLAWTSDANGAVNGTKTAKSYSGKIDWVAIVPSMVDVPTNLYDIEITDDDGVDVLAGAGANRSATVNEYIASASLGACANDKLELKITNAGNAKKGTVYLLIRA